jgi:hypothetical protein
VLWAGLWTLGLDSIDRYVSGVGLVWFSVGVVGAMVCTCKVGAMVGGVCRRGCGGKEACK